MTRLIGRQIDKYEIRALLGHGGMGSVYRAYDQKLKREVALKVMHPHLASQLQFQQRFMQEAQVAAGLGDHPSIVTIYEFDYLQVEELLFLVMQLVRGGTLRDHFERARREGRVIELRETLCVLAQVADALDYAHGRGAIHRDVKPSNVLLRHLDKPDREGDPPLRAVVADFGLAKLQEVDSHTQTGAVVGTPAYLSPEQCLTGEVDRRSDIYSLGVVLYQLTTGHLPLEIKSPTEAVRKHQTETPPFPRQVQPGLPAGVERVIVRAMEKDPAFRFQTAGEMARGLRGVAGTLTDDEVTEYAPAESVESLVTLLAQPGPPPEPSQVKPEDLRPATKARLILGRKGEIPFAIPLDRGFLTIGRSEDNDLLIDSPQVSRLHAQVEFDGVHCSILDRGSRNGTFLGDIKLLAGVSEEWIPGQPLRIGDYWLYLVPAQEHPSSIIVDSDGTMVDPGLVSQKGTIGVFVDATQLAVEAGSFATATVIVLNQGPEVAHFRVSAGGIPDHWVVISPDELRLMPGEQREVTVTIQPPRSPESRAGDHPCAVRVSDTGEQAEVQCTVSVKPYSQFRSELYPKRLRAGHPGQITIYNEGNADSAFEIAWQDRAADLDFEPRQAQVEVAADASASATFQASPHQRRWIGGQKVHPFTTEVTSTAKVTQTRSGEVVSRGVIPVWVPPIVLLLFAALCGTVLFLPPIIPSPPTPSPRPAWTSEPPPNPTATSTVTPMPTATSTLIPVLTATQSHPPVMVLESLVGRTVEEATDWLAGQGLVVDVTHDEYEYDTTVRKDRILRTRPQAGETVEWGSEVILVISKGPEPTTDPCPQTGGVIFYLHENYECGRQRKGQGYHLVEASGVADIPEHLDEQASSLHIPPGRSVMVYQHKDRTGGFACFAEDVETFVGERFNNGGEINDTVSSFEVFDRSDCLFRCTVVYDRLFLRTGPGTDYDKITPLPTNTGLEPVVYYAGGYPEKGWVQVKVEDTDDEGWCRALAKCVLCYPDDMARLPGAAARNIPDTPTPAPTKIPQPTPTKTPRPGLPDIPSFECTGCTIGKGECRCTIGEGECIELKWGLVTGAKRVSIEPDIKGVGTPGKKWVCPSKTTTYVMRAIGPGGTTDRSITIIVIPRPKCANKIAFHSDRDGNLEIYVMDADGSNQRRLTYNSAADTVPVWSPDCQRMTFQSQRDGNWEIYTMNADGSDVARLTRSAGLDGDAVWSPDGKQIAFASNRGGNNEIYVMNNDGSSPTNLTKNPSHDQRPAWSRNGERIAFQSHRDGNWEIYTMNADGSGLRRLTSSGASDQNPDWSPNGKIVFQSNRDGSFEIYVINADGGGLQRLTYSGATNWNPDWSADGRQIVFNSDRDGNLEVYVMNADGSAVRRLTFNPAFDNESDW